MRLTRARLYFAYSTTLDPDCLALWSRGADRLLLLGPGEIAEAPDRTLKPSLRSRRWAGDIPTLVQDPGKVVFGVLYSVLARDWPLVVACERDLNEATQTVNVRVRVGERYEIATAFVIPHELRHCSGISSERFAEVLARGALKAGLPESYAQALKAGRASLSRLPPAGSSHGPIGLC